MAKQNFSVASQRTTIARTLADLANPLVNSAMNTTNVAILLAETKDLALARTLLKRDWRYFRRHGAGAADSHHHEEHLVGKESEGSSMRRRMAGPRISALLGARRRRARE